MPLPPYGVRALARKAYSRFSLRPPGHVSGLLGAHSFSTARAAAPNVHGIFTHSQNILSRLFARLLAPNVRIPLPPSLSGRALHSSITRAPLGRAAVQQGFSYPVRNALGRPIGLGTFFPRAPQPVMRVSTTVGLGSARNFSSARPLFQNLVENVPIALRTLYEADMDEVKVPSKRFAGKRLPTSKTEQGQKGKERAQNLTAFNKVASKQEELDHYFPSPAITVTTYLLVPLAPTPTFRMPLADPLVNNHVGEPTLLHPLAELGSIHMSHELHGLRVSSLFARLDNGDVWSKGVRCSAFSHGNGHVADGEGACTVLKLEFVGWTCAEVKSVIGECGSGWCILHEEREDESMTSESDASSEDENETGLLDSSFIDPSQSLVLPTLDFHPSFAEPSTRSDTSVTRDPWMEIDPCSSEYSGNTAGFDHVSQHSNSWSYGLSSQLLDRVHL